MKALRNISLRLVAAFLLGCGCVVSNAMPMEPPTVQSVAVSQPQIKVLPGRIEISVAGDEPHQVAIYALTGQVVKTLTLTSGVTSIDLPAGYYIVKCDRVSCRVVVK